MILLNTTLVGDRPTTITESSWRTLKKYQNSGNEVERVVPPILMPLDLIRIAGPSLLDCSTVHRRIAASTAAEGLAALRNRHIAVIAGFVPIGPPHVASVLVTNAPMFH